MPLARIVTWLAEDTEGLAKDLRARGFEVVTKSPDEISSEPADLEITVEECASEEALTSASGIARAQDECVFIAPGAITENPRPVPAIPVTSQLEPAVAVLPPVESEEVEQLAAIHQLEDWSEALPQIPVMAESVADLAVEAQPQFTAQPETILEPQLAASLSEQLAEPMAEVAELRGEDELVAHEYSASVESVPTPISQPSLQAPLGVAEIDPGEYLETQPEEIIEVPAFVPAEAISLVEPQPILETQPETIVEAASEIELDPVSLMEMHTEVAQPVASGEDVWRMEAEPTSDWPIWHPLAETEPPAQDSLVAESLVKRPALALPLTTGARKVFKESGPQVVPLMQSAVPVRPNTYRQRILQKRVIQNDEVFWKTATVLAMVAVAALLVGASANRFSPLPANLVQRSIEAQQPVPFEKAGILPLNAGNKIGSELPPAHEPDVARFHPALAIEPAAPRIVPETPDRANNHLVRTRPLRHSAGHAGSDIVAEDTVVRYDKKHPPASHTQAQKNSGVKQYSDLD